MAKELKGLALGLAAGLGVVGLAYISSAAVTHAQSADSAAAEALQSVPSTDKAPADKAPAGKAPPGKAPAPAGAMDTTHMVAMGRTLYVSNCASCHGQDAEGKIGPTLHALGDPDAKVYRHIANGFTGKMPAYKDKLTKDQIDTLVAYIQSLK